MKKLLSFFVSGIIAMSVLITGGIVTGAEVVNKTTTYIVQDIKNLQNFLINKPTEENLSGKSYDLNGDNKWNI